jgi:hypothetical protein
MGICCQSTLNVWKHFWQSGTGEVLISWNSIHHLLNEGPCWTGWQRERQTKDKRWLQAYVNSIKNRLCFIHQIAVYHGIMAKTLLSFVSSLSTMTCGPNDPAFFCCNSWPLFVRWCSMSKQGCKKIPRYITIFARSMLPCKIRWVAIYICLSTTQAEGGLLVVFEWLSAWLQKTLTSSHYLNVNIIPMHLALAWKQLNA